MVRVPAFPLRRFMSIANIHRRNSLAVVKRIVAVRCSTALEFTAHCGCAALNASARKVLAQIASVPVAGNRVSTPFAGSAPALHFVSLRSRAVAGSPLRRFMPIANHQRRNSLAVVERVVAALYIVLRRNLRRIVAARR